MGLKVFDKFVGRAVLPLALFSFVMLVPEAYSASTGEKVAVCHRTSSATNPFVLTEISANSLDAHRVHGDREPTAGKCPGPENRSNTSNNANSTNPRTGGTGAGNTGSSNTGTSTGTGQERVTLCHATGSATNPFFIESVAAPAVQAHLAGGDIVPIGGSCPGGAAGEAPAATPEPITMLLFGAGLAGVGYAARRRRRNRQPE